MRRLLGALLGVVLHCSLATQEVLIEESSQIESLHAPTGGAVELPCDVTPALAHDHMALVIWYKQGHDTPIYSLDTREGVTSHWSDPTTLGVRASFRSESRPAVLIITKLRAEDNGQYRCRVDFIKSPTKNTRLNLTVLIPPERLIVLNERGEEVRGGVLGPYDEGSRVNVTCVAVGGRPAARVSWWQAHALVANEEGSATAALALSRADHRSRLTCQAVTDPSIAPLTENVSIELNLAPLWVRIVGGRRPLVAGRSVELTCEAVGASPPPHVTWWRGRDTVNTHTETQTTDGNVTRSVLVFTPRLEDGGRALACRAVQPRDRRAVLEDGWTMEIQHVPLVRLSLGASLDGRRVVEGSDVYLECGVTANPPIHLIYFTHHGARVRAGAGVLVANQSLVLQRVSRAAAGAYGCVARNELGEGTSAPLTLDVKYSPVCRAAEAAVVRAARHERLLLHCDLDSNPQELVYEWWFNSSSHSRHELAPTHNTSATLEYWVNSSSEYGWVQCAGTNSVGRQHAPCLIHILPADKPSPVSACDVTNVTQDSLDVSCTPGHDGGIPQEFLLQIFDSETGVLVHNESSSSPVFSVSGLVTASSLTLTVRAYNKKGHSDARTHSVRLHRPHASTARVPVRVELTTVLMVVLAAIGVVALVSALATTVLCYKYCRRKEHKNEKDKRQQEESSNMPLTGSKETESVDSLDKNPDIIPLDGKISDSCSNKSSATDYSSIRPLISRAECDVTGCERYYEHGECAQYLHVRADYRRPTYTPTPGPRLLGPGVSLGPRTNLGPSVQGVGPMALHSEHIDQCRYDKVYEDWLKYKNSLPLNTSGLLPPEQLLPPDPYALYSNPSRINLQQMPDLEHRYHLDQRLATPDSRSCSNSPPVRFNIDNSVYYTTNVDHSHTLPHTKGRTSGNSQGQLPSDNKQCSTIIEASQLSNINKQ